MNRPFLLDLFERTAATYVETFAGLFLADSTGLLSLGAVKVAAVAALPAAAAVVKGALAGSVGTTSTAAAQPAPKPLSAGNDAASVPEKPAA